MNKLRIFITGILLLVLSGNPHAAVLLDRVVAVVNQEVITWSELYTTMEADASATIKGLQADERRRIFRQNEAVFLENLINVRLQLQEARNKGIRVSEEELQDAINGIKKKYAMTDSVFRESLKEEGISFEEYKKRLREQIIIGKLVNVQIRSKIAINDEDIDKFVSENRDLLENIETYKISQILLKKQKDVENSKIEEKAGEILGKLEQGESFSDLARQYSEDSSSNGGGDLGFLKKSQLNKDFLDVISGMKPGDVSKPFWTENGLHVIKLEAMTEVRSKEEMREEARGMLNNRIFTAKYNEWIKSLRERSFIEVRL
ncbi:MAG: peptidylprolyl isomerase [Nitrospirota bacterium]|nr:peptidylprolyl isomerase [Nitrospirota bacterium]